MMPTTYKHLDESVLEQTTGDRWVPSIPLPFYIGSRLFTRQPRAYQCGCGDQFKSEAEYKIHYRTEQLLEMNKIFTTVRDLQTGKATFWRRATFVLQHGTTRQGEEMVDHFDKIGWPEMVDINGLNKLNDEIMQFWAPLYDKLSGAAHKVVEDEDDFELEDETPEEALKDFAEPYTVENTKGVKYYLNKKRVASKSGQAYDQYFFTKTVMPEFAETKMPAGYVSYETANGQIRVKRENEKRVRTKNYTHTNSKGVTYHLNVKDVSLRGGKMVPIYYFSKDVRPEATTLPKGWKIAENPRNGFLTVRKPSQD